MASSSQNEVVILGFSNSDLDSKTWKDILGSLVKKSPWSAAGQDFSCEPQYLQRMSTRTVVEQRLSTGNTSVSLSECTRWTNEPDIKSLQASNGVELVIQPSALYAAHKTPGLAVFDMDSTLIQQEVIDELARAVGFYDKVAAITEAAMRGEAPYTDFEVSLRARVALLNGVPTSIWEQLKQGIITFAPGAPELIRVLKALGWKTAVLSGGFTPLAYWVKDTLGLDYAFANQLVADNSKHVLTGELVADAPIVHGEKKRELLLQLANENKIPVAQVIAVGDGSNDLPMMGAAGLGVAFNAKPKVQDAAPARVNSKSLLDVMHVLGYNQAAVDDILATAPSA
ncbi:putative phosphoserine phosphatase, HAD superfamily [Acrodontium crateriforme]|uniref:phosphoserine phosphatase n=1 Tax=Acrodontium crateriforme TaxID=150365 RepID=A0AAQ3MB81_9PEZI|nr:putative phosphoserine phosphatase, HAD superfamily [Acrodontium crateriforme]